MLKAPKNLAPRPERVFGGEARELAEAERQLIEAALRLAAAWNAAGHADMIDLQVLTEFDYAAAILESARARMDAANAVDPVSMIPGQRRGF